MALLISLNNQITVNILLFITKLEHCVTIAKIIFRYFIVLEAYFFFQNRETEKEKHFSIIRNRHTLNPPQISRCPSHYALRRKKIHSSEKLLQSEPKSLPFHSVPRQSLIFGRCVLGLQASFHHFCSIASI